MPTPSSPVSTVIPTRNRAALVVRAIDSVLAASRAGDEVIVVDDGSTDDTPRRLVYYGDRIRVIRTVGLGAGAARNRGVAASRHPLIAFLDSDDEWMPDRLELGRRLMDSRPDLLFCFTDFGVRVPGYPDRHHGADGWLRRTANWSVELGAPSRYSAITGAAPSGRDDFNVHIGDLSPLLIDSCPVGAQTLLVRRELGRSALHFAEDLPTFEDWECAIRLARAGQAAFLDCETAWQYGHAAPRITDAHYDALVPAMTHLKLMSRLLEPDSQFMRRYGPRVRAARRRENLDIGKTLMLRGDHRASAIHFRRAGWPYRALAFAGLLPPRVARAAISARNWLRSTRALNK